MGLLSLGHSDHRTSAAVLTELLAYLNAACTPYSIHCSSKLDVDDPENSRRFKFQWPCSTFASDAGMAQSQEVRLLECGPYGSAELATRRKPYLASV